MYSIDYDVMNPSGCSTDELNTILTEGLEGLGAAFEAAEVITGINAMYMIAHAALESAWGTSEIATTKNNLFGFNAVDSDPSLASGFASLSHCIQWWAMWMKNNYLTPGAQFYNGTTIHDIFIMYSTSHDTEANSVVEIMNDLKSKLPQGEEMIDTDQKAMDLLRLGLHDTTEDFTQEAIDSIKGQPYSAVVPALIQYPKWKQQNDWLVAFPQLQAQAAAGSLTKDQVIAFLQEKL